MVPELLRYCGKRGPLNPDLMVPERATKATFTPVFTGTDGLRLKHGTRSKIDEFYDKEMMEEKQVITNLREEKTVCL